MCVYAMYHASGTSCHFVANKLFAVGLALNVITMSGIAMYMLTVMQKAGVGEIHLSLIRMTS